MIFDEYPDITNYKLKAIGKLYVSYTHNNPTQDMTLFMEKAVDIIEEFNEDVLKFINILIEKIKKEDDDK